MIFAISDTHFDHANIIRYQNRPFASVNEMNDALLRNWRHTVGKDDVVYFLGDVSFGRGSRSTEWWLSRLPGHIIFICGSHDRLGVECRKSMVILFDGIKFYLVHSPSDIAETWNGWVIHGHKHNDVPFIDFDKQRVNVSVEVVGYKPVALSTIVKAIRSGERVIWPESHRGTQRSAAARQTRERRKQLPGPALIGAR